MAAFGDERADDGWSGGLEYDLLPAAARVLAQELLALAEEIDRREADEPTTQLEDGESWDPKEANG